MIKVTTEVTTDEINNDFRKLCEASWHSICDESKKFNDKYKDAMKGHILYSVIVNLTCNLLSLITDQENYKNNISIFAKSVSDLLTCQPNNESNKLLN